MIFLNIFKHLLPNAKAWRITTNKQLRQFFSGLSGIGAAVKHFVDLVWLDIFPTTTRELDKWEKQFGLRNIDLTENQRRARLIAAWQAVGGQDPHYIQNVLRDNGFDVYVHEWWQPGTEAPPGVKKCAVPRNPFVWLSKEYTGVKLTVDCDEPLAACGESFAECGNRRTPKGYPLVNIVIESKPKVLVLCGEEIVECGENLALCNNYVAFSEDRKNYTIPEDRSKWPYFLYIGGSVFGSVAQIDAKRKDELEELALKICPAQQWLGMLVEYI